MAVHLAGKTELVWAFGQACPAQTRSSSAGLLQVFRNFQEIAIRLANSVLTRTPGPRGKLLRNLRAISPVLCINTLNVGDPKENVGCQFSFLNRGSKRSVGGNI